MNAPGSLRECIPLPDLTEVPAIGSPERDQHERQATARARELVFQEDGRLREALYALEQELRGEPYSRDRVLYVDIARKYARELVDHVEQCWASAVVR